MILIAHTLHSLSKIRAGKIRFSGAQKPMLINANSGEHCAPCNFVHLLTLQFTHVHRIVYLIVHQIKYVMERWSNAIIFFNFLTYGLKSYPRKQNPDFFFHGYPKYCFCNLFKYFPLRYACIHNHSFRFEPANCICSKLITVQRWIQEPYNIQDRALCND